MYSGNDDIIVPMMSIGSSGVISVLANIAPKQTHNMVNFCLEGNYIEGNKIQQALLEVANDLFLEVNPIPVKAALNMIGYNVGKPRLPLIEMSHTGKERLRKALVDFGLEVV